ncbi:MAG: MotA/TolQ/ExbB proton channel family protein [Deltaproteobacteria bacterium]|nr:MotA/TolQ/ExbB proton channel family protein [Deltaproteobacteria bacterium]
MSDLINLDVISRGGPVMIPLLICSVLAMAMIIERLFFLRGSKILSVDVLREIEVAIKSGDLKTALEWTEETKTPMTRIARIALINSDKPREDLKASLEEAGRQEVPVLERYFNAIYTIAVITPLLGLLGTVLGMIHVFDTVVQEGGGNTSLLAGGISEALITTASGMTIAIPTLVFYNYISKKAEHLLVDMEHHSLILHELLTSRESH